jgi:imidazolonepropionase-like amidohydrolase
MLRTFLTATVGIFAIGSLCLADEISNAEYTTSKDYAVVGGTIVGVGRATLIVRNGFIDQITTATIDDDLPTVEASERFILAAFIDSHVHLAYEFSAQKLAEGGIAAAVDLAAPVSFLKNDFKPMKVILAGPMITALGGYPTKSWGSDGYGLEISGVAAARDAVETLFRAGARVIKMPIGDATGAGALTMAKNPAMLSDEEMKAVVDQAHSYDMRVATHALNNRDVLRAANAGVDVLAHTPTERLTNAAIAAWSTRAVISTLAAFPKLSMPVENVRRLREAGATVLYGTDMGYTTFPGINPLELELLAKAGLDNQAIIAAGTTVPAAYWGFGDGLGTLSGGGKANFLILDADPEVDPSTLSRPLAVYLNGRRIEPAR